MAKLKIDFYYHFDSKIDNEYDVDKLVKSISVTARKITDSEKRQKNIDKNKTIYFVKDSASNPYGSLWITMINNEVLGEKWNIYQLDSKNNEKLCEEYYNIIKVSDERKSTV